MGECQIGLVRGWQELGSRGAAGGQQEGSRGPDFRQQGASRRAAGGLEEGSRGAETRQSLLQILMARQVQQICTCGITGKLTTSVSMQQSDTVPL